MTNVVAAFENYVDRDKVPASISLKILRSINFVNIASIDLQLQDHTNLYCKNYFELLKKQAY